ncbi:MAG: hypothetical protein ABIP76_15845 [Verrucomicrobiota bacterium]
MTNAQNSRVTTERAAKYFLSLRSAILCFLSVVVFIGCKSSYDVTVGTMGTNRKFSGVTKPIYNKATGKYVFKDAMGQEFSVPAGQIRMVEPHGESSDPKFVTPAPKK